MNFNRILIGSLILDNTIRYDGDNRYPINRLGAYGVSRSKIDYDHNITTMGSYTWNYFSFSNYPINILSFNMDRSTYNVKRTTPVCILYLETKTSDVHITVPYMPILRSLLIYVQDTYYNQSPIVGRIDSHDIRSIEVDGGGIISSDFIDSLYKMRSLSYLDINNDSGCDLDPSRIPSLRMLCIRSNALLVNIILPDNIMVLHCYDYISWHRMRSPMPKYLSLKGRSLPMIYELNHLDVTKTRFIYTEVQVPDDVKNKYSHIKFIKGKLDMSYIPT